MSTQLCSTQGHDTPKKCHATILTQATINDVMEFFVAPGDMSPDTAAKFASVVAQEEVLEDMTGKTYIKHHVPSLLNNIFPRKAFPNPDMADTKKLSSLQNHKHLGLKGAKESNPPPSTTELLENDSCQGIDNNDEGLGEMKPLTVKGIERKSSIQWKDKPKEKFEFIHAAQDYLACTQPSLKMIPKAIAKIPEDLVLEKPHLKPKEVKLWCMKEMTDQQYDLYSRCEAEMREYARNLCTQKKLQILETNESKLPRDAADLLTILDPHINIYDPYVCQGKKSHDSASSPSFIASSIKLAYTSRSNVYHHPNTDKPLQSPNVRITTRPDAPCEDTTTWLQQGTTLLLQRPARRAYNSPQSDGLTFTRHEVYQAIYTLFTRSKGAQLLPLLLDLFNAQAIGGLGIFQEDAAGIDRLRVIHGLRRYPGTITQPSANLGRSFGYIDDVEGQECELVQVDAAMLSKAVASRVYLMAQHEAAISQNPDRDYIPAIPEGIAHTEMLQVHKVCFLPFEIVPLVLCRGLTPKQAFQVLHHHILQQGLVDVCKPLLDTLQAVGTQPTTLLGTIWLLEPGPSFQAEVSLCAYMKKNVLLRDLPGPSSAPADPTLTTAFTALTDHQLRLSETMDQRRQESSKLHTVREVWEPLYTERLLLLCGKTNEADLPPIYTAWAKKSKHEKTHMILQSQVATDAYNLGIQAPLITTAVFKQFQDCNFYGANPFDVADGILPLAFTPPGGSAAILKREHEEAANVAAYDTMISTQGNSLSLKDSLELQKTKVYIPLDWTRATTQLKSYMAVLVTLLGATHDVVKCYQQEQDEVGERITRAMIVVYYFQVRVQGWMEEQWESDIPLPSPDFGEDIHRFRMTQNLNWLPNVSNVDALRALQHPPPPKGVPLWAPLLFHAHPTVMISYETPTGIPDSRTNPIPSSLASRIEQCDLSLPP
eukprot:jgi/Psemu1/15352/gm1.15352_g